MVRTSLAVILLVVGLSVAAVMIGLRLTGGVAGPEGPSAPASLQDALVLIPAGKAVLGSREAGGESPRSCEFAVFWMGSREVTVGEYATYLNATSAAAATGMPQMVWTGDSYRPRRGQRNRPVSHVSREDAVRYCEWLSSRVGAKVRLPTEEEWEYAARGGIHGSRQPWGWGTPEGRACFAAEGPEPVGVHKPNPYGLHDMAGNVFEWCATTSSQAIVRGGSWAERDPKLLRVYTRTRVSHDYRDADVGFRVIVDPS